MDFGLTDRVALVTGGTGGIGRATVEVLAAEGARVLAVGRDPGRIAELERHPTRRVAAVAADLSTEEGCIQAVEACRNRFGDADVLVNCAGAAGTGNVLGLTREEIDSALGLKFHGYLRMSQLVAPAMRARGWGRIVNVAGSAGTSPTATNLPTSLANIAVYNATRALSDELAESGVLVNIVSPGLTLTDRARNLMRAQVGDDDAAIDLAIERAAESLPAKRAATPDDVARAVAFLASDACRYVFASALYMEGGSRRSTP
jgi:NAD(P)-dependent dehydrogenase (short-subunit alcohol dehydrogenase family)